MGLSTRSVSDFAVVRCYILPGSLQLRPVRSFFEEPGNQRANLSMCRDQVEIRIPGKAQANSRLTSVARTTTGAPLTPIRQAQVTRSLRSSWGTPLRSRSPAFRRFPFCPEHRCQPIQCPRRPARLVLRQAPQVSPTRATPKQPAARPCADIGCQQRECRGSAAAAPGSILAGYLDRSPQS